MSKDAALRAFAKGFLDIRRRGVAAQARAAAASGSKVPGAQVFINDYWQLALAEKAYGVHLGQEDLDTAALAALHNAGLRLVLSTHTPAELARAHALQPYR